MMNAPLSGRIAVVTGATAGIGEAIARAFAAGGASVVVNGRREDKLNALAQELGGLVVAPAKVAAVAGDAADAGVIDRMLGAAKEQCGRNSDLVVVNAGRGLNGSLLTSDMGAWEELIKINVLGAARLIRAAAEKMLERSVGKVGTGVLTAGPRDIIAIGSVVGRHGSPFSSMYGGTKFALHGMIEGVRRELSAKGIRVTLIEPGFVVSEFQDVAGYQKGWVKEMFEKIGPPLTPDDVARAVTFVAAQPAGVHISDLLIRPTRQEYP